MKLAHKIGLAGLTLITLNQSAQAVDVGVLFSGLVAETCAVNVGTTGTLALSADATVLSSENAGGIQGTAVVTTNGLGSTIEVVAPSSFLTGPSTADTNTVFDANYDLSGATIVTNILNTVTTPLNLGTTTISMDATATKTVGSFSAGAYSLITTVRCTSSV